LSHLLDFVSYRSAVAVAKSFVGLPAAIGALAAIALAFAGVGEALRAWPLLLTAIVIAVGSITLPKRPQLPLDLSYGLYLYAFPIQQLSATLFTDFWPGGVDRASHSAMVALHRVLRTGH
jgi:peptidoglycan/LPS O-acetylase OafA/YrhL